MRNIVIDRRGRAPLVVVSNRLPYNLPRKPGSRPPKRNVGGLVNTLEPVLARRGGCWVGWDGSPLPSGSAVEEALAKPVVFRTQNGIELHGIPLSERDVGLYYNGFSNRALWPLFHDLPGLAVFLPDHFAAYERVNRRFAELTLERAVMGSRIWIHDLHLLLVPRFLRDLGFPGRIDFFLHTPFPPPEIFRALPWRQNLLRGILAADSIAFHVPLYRDNFVRCACQIAGAELIAEEAKGPTLVWHAGGETEAAAIPIGIDVEDFENLARSPAVVSTAERLRKEHGNCRILFCADRLDYTKGIRERLQFFERFLESRPEFVGRVVLIQVVVPSRHQVDEYRAMKREIDCEVGRINGEHSRDGWTPIHYRYRALDREDLVSHYLAADVAMVTSVRDGMNLVAAEFAASRVDDDGVLIVSEFAGIAERSPGAILVNPHDVDGCSEALAAALEMRPAERKDRMVRLRERVRSNPSSRWAERCLGPGEFRSWGWTPVRDLARAADPAAGTSFVER
jgi:alpha,alpha-trehalose-phosphate synthase [UDP-forming]